MRRDAVVTGEQIEPVDLFRVRLVGVLNWAEDSLRCNYQRLCRWMSLAESLSPGKARMEVIRARPASSGCGPRSH